jgi:hypothetical protein
MIKKDPIFWWASGIFALALLLFFITKSQDWLFLGIISYLLRPTLASLGIARRHMDERQMTINYRSGNIAFTVTIVTCVIVAVILAAQDNHAFEYFHMVIIVGLAAKALFNVILTRNFREAAAKILIGVGLLVALFNAFHSFDNFTIIRFVKYIIPGLSIAGIGVLSKFYARPTGALIIVATAFLLWRIFDKGFTWGQIATAVIVCVPLLIGGAFLMRAKSADNETESEVMKS